MNLDPKIFKAYDIRGIYPTQINEENIIPVIDSIYTFFKKKLGKDSVTVALGYDMRTSTPSLTAVVKKRLLELGAHIVDIGLVSTPTFYFAVNHYNYETGIQVTASHNPKEYNGLKFVMNSDTGLIKIGKITGMEEIKEMAVNGITPELPGNGTEEKKEHILEEEVTFAKELLGNPTLNKYKIVADPANAMGAQYIDALFKDVPADLVKMNFEYDGTFPAHQPDPLDYKNLKDLQAKVLAEKADLGLAPDGDGDRLFFIDEKGQIVPASHITALVAREFLKTNPGATILFDIRYILTPSKIVEENGGKSHITRVGHAFISKAMAEVGGVFAGESSAHNFFKATGNAEAQLPVILTVLKVMTEEGKTLSEIIAEIRRSFESGEFNFEVANSAEILTKLKEQYKDGQIDELDGVAINFPTWRCSIRTSNTEPLLRLNVEATTKEEMEAKKTELISFIEQHKIQGESVGH